MTIEDGLHYVVIFSAYVVIWFITLFCLLPIGMGGPMDPETGAPLNPMLKKKMLWATGIAAVVWAVFYTLIGFGWLEL
jgi:predicted secreted protein